MESHYYTITNSYFSTLPNHERNRQINRQQYNTDTRNIHFHWRANLNNHLHLHLPPHPYYSHLTPHTHVPQETLSEQQSTMLFCTTCCSAEEADCHSMKKTHPNMYYGTNQPNSSSTTLYIPSSKSSIHKVSNTHTQYYSTHSSSNIHFIYRLCSNLSRYA